MRKNSITLLGAAILASGIFYVVNNPDLFMASILSLQEKQFIVEQWWDAAYKTDNNTFEIFVAENYADNLSNFQCVIYLDPEKVEMNIDAYTGQGEISIQKQIDGNLYITVTNIKNIDINKEIVGIPFSGDARLVFLWESKGKTENKRKDFAVGNLSTFTPHSK